MVLILLKGYLIYDNATVIIWTMTSENAIIIPSLYSHHNIICFKIKFLKSYNVFKIYFYPAYHLTV